MIGPRTTPSHRHCSPYTFLFGRQDGGRGLEEARTQGIALLGVVAANQLDEPAFLQERPCLLHGCGGLRQGGEDEAELLQQFHFFVALPLQKLDGQHGHLAGEVPVIVELDSWNENRAPQYQM